MSFVLSVYMVRTIWFSVKTLERGNYDLMGLNDINIKGNKDEYFRHLIICLSKKTKANYNTINSKVDNMTMAQEYYKRGIVTICVYAFLILIFCFFFKNSKKPVLEFKPKFVYASSSGKSDDRGYSAKATRATRLDSPSSGASLTTGAAAQRRLVLCG